MAKKVTAKKVTKKVINAKEEVKKMNEEQSKMEKETIAFQKRLDLFGKAVEKIAQKHDIKVLLQGFDNSFKAPFIMGCKIDTDFEARAMESFILESIARSRK